MFQNEQQGFKIALLEMEKRKLETEVGVGVLYPRLTERTYAESVLGYC